MGDQLTLPGILGPDARCRPGARGGGSLRPLKIAYRNGEVHEGMGLDLPLAGLAMVNDPAHLPGSEAEVSIIHIGSGTTLGNWNRIGAEAALRYVMEALQPLGIDWTTGRDELNRAWMAGVEERPPPVEPWGGYRHRVHRVHRSEVGTGADGDDACWAHEAWSAEPHDGLWEEPDAGWYEAHQHAATSRGVGAFDGEPDDWWNHVGEPGG